MVLDWNVGSRRPTLGTCIKCMTPPGAVPGAGLAAERLTSTPSQKESEAERASVAKLNHSPGSSSGMSSHA